MQRDNENSFIIALTFYTAMLEFRIDVLVKQVYEEKWHCKEYKLLRYGMYCLSQSVSRSVNL